MLRGKFLRYNFHIKYQRISIPQTYPLSTEFVMKKMVPELGKGTDPDRMKGALFVLSSKTLRKFF